MYHFADMVLGRSETEKEIDDPADDGIHREELDADTLLKLKDQPHKPTYAMHGFVW